MKYREPRVSPGRVERVRAAVARHGATSVVEKVLARTPAVTWDALLNTGRREPLVSARRAEIWSVLHGTLALNDCELARMFGVHSTSVRHARFEREIAFRHTTGRNLWHT